MNNLKYLIIILGCLFVVACSESGAKKAVYERLTGGDSKIKRSDLKFVKFTPVEEDYACYAVNTGDNANDVQLLMHRNQGKWTVDEVLIGSHEKGLQKVKLKVHEDKELSAVKKAILGRLKDQESAQFGEFTLVGERACITVNARNSMGGYTGDQELLLTKINSEWIIMDLPIENLGHAFCSRMIEREKDKGQKQNEATVNATHSGKILQTLQTENYSHIEVEENGKKFWVATPSEVYIRRMLKLEM